MNQSLVGEQKRQFSVDWLISHLLTWRIIALGNKLGGKANE
ncbi:hypothetical protein J2R98_002395 [Alkalibacillus filiformis]|uniref:Uncharacterized protein n=1 Tax=Alkalibacillus filiformis TaxID=200990 RepID=A0ABU0DW09_9BACI|nr:hypothetical protein [Alkalibacillus filiformis]